MDDIEQERKRVAEMCAACTEIMQRSSRPDGTTPWAAMMWSNATGGYVIGHGESAWEAVQAVHAEHAKLES